MFLERLQKAFKPLYKHYKIPLSFPSSIQHSYEAAWQRFLFKNSF